MSKVKINFQRYREGRSDLFTLKIYVTIMYLHIYYYCQLHIYFIVSYILCYIATNYKQKLGQAILDLRFT